MRKQASALDGAADRAQVAEHPLGPMLAWRLAGGFLLVIATTARRGSSWQDSWFASPSVALVTRTTLDSGEGHRPACVSRAAVCRLSLAPDTTYTFSYAIVMRTGARVWAGSGSLAITVDPTGALSAADAGAPAGVATPSLK